MQCTWDGYVCMNLYLSIHQGYISWIYILLQSDRSLLALIFLSVERKRPLLFQKKKFPGVGGFKFITSLCIYIYVNSCLHIVLASFGPPSLEKERSFFFLTPGRRKKMSTPPPPKDPNITPALKPPPGVTSNLINPPSRGYITLIVFVTYLGVTTPMVCLRMYVRRFINRKVWWDDCMFSLPLLCPIFSFPFSAAYFHKSWRRTGGVLVLMLRKSDG